MSPSIIISDTAAQGFSVPEIHVYAGFVHVNALPDQLQVVERL